MAHFRKKPVEIEARQLTAENAAEIATWINTNGHVAQIGSPSITTSDHVFIDTLEGTHRADPGDWIIRGVAGEFYPCKPEIFEATYDPVAA